MNRNAFVMYTEYAEKFAKLSDEQMGKLVRMMLQYAQTEKVPQTDDIVLAITFDCVKADMDKQYAKYQSKAIAGKKGGLASRAKQAEAEASIAKQAEANASKLKQMQADASTIKQSEAEPSTAKQTQADASKVNLEKENKKEKEKENKKNIKRYMPISFSEFWDEYPRKVGKANAEAIYNRKAVNAETEQAILDGLRRYNSLQWSKWTGEQRQYIPYPASWLNAGRWTDTVEQSGKSVPKYMTEPIEPDTEAPQTDLDALKELMDKL